MKIIATLFLFVAFISAIGQEPIEVKIQDRPSSVGVHPAFETVVPQATRFEAIDVLKTDFLPRGLFKKNAKVKKVKDEWLVDNVVLEDITSNPLDLITQVSSFPGHIYVRFFFRGADGFLGEEGISPQTTEAASQFVRNYGVKLYRQAVESELAEEEKQLSKLKNSLDRLGRKNNTFDDRIGDALQTQQDVDYEADSRKMELKEAERSSYVGSEQLEEMEDQLKSTEKELTKAKREEARMKRKIGKNEKEQRDLVLEIEKQEEKVQRVKEKLDNIR
jgi:hypothetical protein